MKRGAPLSAGGGALALLSLASCGPVPAALPPRPSARAYVFALLGAEAPALYAYDAEALPDPLRLEGEALEVLAYDHPLSELLAAREDGVVEPSPSSASDDEAWTLPAPDALYALEDGALVARSPSSADRWLAGLRVPRPPCATAPRLVPMRATPKFDVSSILADGDQVWLGFAVPPDQPESAVYRVPLSALAGNTVEYFSRGRLESRVFPRLFRVGAEVRALWRPGGVAPVQLARLARDGTVTGTAGASADFADGLVLDGVAGGLHAGRETIVADAHGRDRSEAADRDYLLSYEASSASWRVLTSRARGRSCPGTRVLEVDGPGRGWVGVANGAILRFDEAEDGGLVEGSELVPGLSACASSRATLADGVELVSYRTPGGGSGLLWRQPGGSWSELHQAVEGLEIAAIGDAAVTDLGGKALIFEHTASRPELPPRLCHVLEPGLQAVYARRIDERHVALGGTGAVLVQF